MRNLLFLLVGMICMLATGCQYRSYNKLYGSLRTYSVVDTASGDTFVGVRSKKDTIVAAADYSSLWADKEVIVCTRKDFFRDVFFHNGDSLGLKTFHDFNKHEVGKNVFYIGQNRDSACCYFPKNNISFGKEIFTADGNVFIRQNEEWNVYNSNGSWVWSFPVSAQFVKDVETGKFFIAISRQLKPKICVNGKIYTPDGKVYHSYRVYHWWKFQKQLTHPISMQPICFFEVNLSLI